MGYSTDFTGSFSLTPTLTAERVAEINKFSEKDHRNDSDSVPGYYCQWVASEDGTELEWDGNEKFYNYIEWLQYMIDRFFKPWGVVVSGSVDWDGEASGDTGTILVKDNEISTTSPEDIKSAAESARDVLLHFRNALDWTPEFEAVLQDLNKTLDL